MHQNGLSAGALPKTHLHLFFPRPTAEAYSTIQSQQLVPWAPGMGGKEWVAERKKGEGKGKEEGKEGELSHFSKRFDTDNSYLIMVCWLVVLC